MTTPKNKNEKDNNSSEGKRLFNLPPPSHILHNAMKYSPLLIGWNDDAFREIIEDYRKRRKESNNAGVDVERIGFGPQLIINDVMAEFVNNRSEYDELKSEWKKFEVSATETSGKGFREMKLYQNLLGSIKYQRDAYFMGEKYAEERQSFRAVEDEKGKKTLAFPFGPITKKMTTYEHHLEKQPILPQITTASVQLTNLAEWFIPSPTMHNALLPTVLWTISPPPNSGPLRKQAARASSDLIPLSQPVLDRAMKNSLVWVLNNSKWRESIKGSTRGLVGRLQEDDSGNVNENGRFVTTKTINVNE